MSAARVAKLNGKKKKMSMNTGESYIEMRATSPFNRIQNAICSALKGEIVVDEVAISGGAPAIDAKVEEEDQALLCSICNDEATISADPKLCSLFPACTHSNDFGVQCIKQFISVKIKEHALNQLKCPHPDCIERFSKEFISSIANEDEIKIYNSDVSILAKKKQQDESIYNKVISYCFPLVDSLVQTVQSLTRRLVTDSKRCPSCRYIIEKDGGCSHMTCRRCGHEFHWCCGQNYRGTHCTAKCSFVQTGLPILICIVPLSLGLYSASGTSLGLYFVSIIVRLLLGLALFLACGFFGSYTLRNSSNAIFAPDDLLFKGMQYLDTYTVKLGVKKECVGLIGALVCSFLFAVNCSTLVSGNDVFETLVATFDWKMKFYAFLPLVCQEIYKLEGFDLSSGDFFHLLIAVAMFPVNFLTKVSIFIMYVTFYHLLSCHESPRLAIVDSVIRKTLPTLFCLIQIGTTMLLLVSWSQYFPAIWGISLSILETLSKHAGFSAGISSIRQHLFFFIPHVWIHSVISAAYISSLCYFGATGFLSVHSIALSSALLIAKLGSSYGQMALLLLGLANIRSSSLRLAFLNIYQKFSSKDLTIEVVFVTSYTIVWILAFGWILRSTEYSLLWLGCNIMIDVFLTPKLRRNVPVQPYYGYNRKVDEGVFNDSSRIVSYIFFLLVPVISRFITMASSNYFYYVVAALSILSAVLGYAYFSYVR